MNRPMHSIDYDHLLIAIDHWLFGVNPTQWIYQFAHPVATEILQVAYFSYYLLFIALGVEVYGKRDVRDFDRVGFLVVYGFFLSYLGYFMLPAVGPRFTLHDFSLMSQELPGILLTEPLRSFVNSGGGIPSGSVNPVEFVHRDVFPSGHTQLSLVCVYLAYQYKLSTRHAMAVVVTLLILATVYLRYHYVVDLLAGSLFFGMTIMTGHHIEEWWNRLKNRAPNRPDSGPPRVFHTRSGDNVKQ
ncbi:MAG: phosphatase PAP2 family protein [Proteobacteria bacterium]|nr:phosphatase PAP2 family protein [Pseudomonadota bacterium]